MNAEDFLIKDYELKIRYLTDHFQRMWMRFNFFVTIESALVGGKVIFSPNAFSWMLCLVGALLSLVWYVFGAEDRYLVRVYRSHVRDAAERILHQLGGSGSELTKAYRHVGEITRSAEALDKEDKAARKMAWRKALRIKTTDRSPDDRSLSNLLLERISGWRFEAFSTTRLASLFPLFLFVLWLIALAFEIHPARYL